MAVFRVNLLVDDPQEVFDWIAKHVPEEMVVRHVGYKVPEGWFMKVVFKLQSDAERFHEIWVPEALDHSVKPWGSTTWKRRPVMAHSCQS